MKITLKYYPIILTSVYQNYLSLTCILTSQKIIKENLTGIPGLKARKQEGSHALVSVG